MMFREGGNEEALVAAAVGASVMGVWSSVATTAAISLQNERRHGTLELLVAAPTSFTLLVVPMTLAMATIGLYSLVATLLWGRFAFGIPISIDQPLVFCLAAVATAVGISLMGFLLAVSSVRYRSAWALGAGLEFPIWIVCGFLIPIVPAPGLGAAHRVGTAADVGGLSGPGGCLRRHPVGDMAMCLLTSAVYAAVGAVLARRLVNSARSHATLALT